ncbi:phospholipase A2 inhibitor beta-like isoform X3 [Periplaneta americana]|uniref:phospholipase A2 inhibitor beta-like isoform X3 n=1 Tax=Periplaneta americana TaxID=6978 RepID=UPI0037E70133
MRFVMMKFAATLVLSCIFFSLSTTTTAKCPSTCVCTSKETTCVNASLSAIPTDLSKDTVKLNLSFNFLALLHNGDLRHLNRLKISHLSNNGIETVESQVFCSTVELVTLNLSHNRMSTLNDDMFRCLNKLRYLYLNNNNISALPRDLLQNNTELTKLDISSNKIQAILPDTFQENEQLSLILIQNNTLFPVSKWASLGDHRLDVIDVDFCKQSILSYQKINILRNMRLGTNDVVEGWQLLTNKVLSNDEQDLINIIKAKLSPFGYTLHDYLVYNVTKNAVTTSFGMSVLCHCDLQDVWFWCRENSTECASPEDQYEILECNPKLELRASIEKTIASSGIKCCSIVIMTLLPLSIPFFIIVLHHN